MSILCKIFGHKMYHDCCNIAGPTICRRCDHKEPAIKWDFVAPMPKVKPPKIEVPDNLKRYICQLEQENAKLKHALEIYTTNEPDLDIAAPEIRY